MIKTAQVRGYNIQAGNQADMFKTPLPTPQNVVYHRSSRVIPSRGTEIDLSSAIS